MTHELIINGQAVDIEGVDITLEYVSGLFQDIGSIHLSRSYTISLPKTRRNLAILDDPSLSHPPLECLFTADEETGMDGAFAFDYVRMFTDGRADYSTAMAGVLFP